MDLIGRVVGNYRITAKLGEGGMGQVYRGAHLRLDREVAIKAFVSQRLVRNRRGRGGQCRARPGRVQKRGGAEDYCL